MVVLGAGYEVLANYQNCSLSFLGINNIHVIRDSQKKVRVRVRVSAVVRVRWCACACMIALSY